jgi:hypothetical protein
VVLLVLIHPYKVADAISRNPNGRIILEEVTGILPVIRSPDASESELME